jgi:DNA-binding FadR family transcriptional regulator
MSFKSIRRRKVHEDVAAQIEEAIISGDLVEGENLPSERHLMESFGVGRPAVREALLMLEVKGFLRLATGGRARITRPTVAVMVDQLSGSAKHLLSSAEGERAFQDARRVFEAAIARNAAEIATPDDIARLGKALEENRNSLDDMAAFERTDLAFHLALAEIGNNPVFAALHGAISGWLSFQRHVALRVEGVAERALQSHEQIYEAVAKLQPDQAWHAMDQHLRLVKEQYVKGKGSAA